MEYFYELPPYEQFSRISMKFREVQKGPKRKPKNNSVPEVVRTLEYRTTTHAGKLSEALRAERSISYWKKFVKSLK